jgi:lysophospholipase L1-like esterase
MPKPHLCQSPQLTPLLTDLSPLVEETPTPYTIAVILGGTNDLNNNRLSLDIYSALQSVWSIPLAHNTKILALTVPECGICSPVWDERSLDLSDLILDHEAENLYALPLLSTLPLLSPPLHPSPSNSRSYGYGAEGFVGLLGRESADRSSYTFDLHTAIPFWSMPKAKRREIWDDGVHFTAKGYDLMGKIIADRLVEVIKGFEGVEEDAKEWQGGELKKRRADSGL